ncbi:MAG: response regulator, partial [Acidobacteriota bacterium]
MKLLYVTGHLRDADFIEHEMHRLVPDSRLDVSPNIEDALQRLSAARDYDAVLVDATLPDGPSVRLILDIRQKALPLAVVVLIGSNDENPPLPALQAGADDYIVKRQHHVSRLPAILHAAIERHSGQGRGREHPFRVLFVGPALPGPEDLGPSAAVSLVSTQCLPDGSLEQLDGGPAEYDAIVVDDSMEAAQVLLALKDSSVRAPEVPMVLLAGPDNETVISQAFKLGVSECVVKSGNYMGRLLPAIEKAVRHRALLRDKATLQSTEARLRLLIELVPTCIALISGEGDFLAVNRAGLGILGASRIDQALGKSIFEWVAAEEQLSLRKFLELVRSGKRGTIQLSCECLDQVRRRLEISAVPLRKDPDARITVLATLQELAAPESTDAQPSTGP